MSMVNQWPTVNKTELRVLILRKYGNQKQFAKKEGIHHDTFRNYLAGRPMPRLERKIVKIMKRHGLNPDGTRSAK